MHHESIVKEGDKPGYYYVKTAAGLEPSFFATDSVAFRAGILSRTKPGIEEALIDACTVDGGKGVGLAVRELLQCNGELVNE